MHNLNSSKLFFEDHFLQEISNLKNYQSKFNKPKTYWFESTEIFEF